MKEYYVYRYYNKNKEVIYVGLTARPIARRVKEHQTEKLAEETYQIEYAQVNSAADMRMYELFYINKHTPKYNTRDSYKDGVNLNLPELNFVPFLEKDKETETKLQGSYDKREYHTSLHTGAVTIVVNNPYGKREEDRSISIKTKGDIYCSKKEFIQIIENCIQAFNDVSDEDYIEINVLGNEGA